MFAIIVHYNLQLLGTMFAIVAAAIMQLDKPF